MENAQLSKAFVGSLESKLKVGNLRAIHLNATPGRRRNRLDLIDLKKVEEKLPQDLLTDLLTKPKFSHKIAVDSKQLTLLSEEQLSQADKALGKLKNLHMDLTSDFQEHGVNSLGFGYPMLIARNPNMPKQLICAPLFIWRLDLEKDPRNLNDWKIKKNEDHPIIINEQLRSYIESEFGGLKLPEIPEGMLDDNLIDEGELLQMVNTIMATLKAQQVEAIPELSATPDKARMENLTGSTPWIAWSGVFGMFRAQRESIIYDLKHVQDHFEDFKETEDHDSYRAFTTSSVTVDPSQEKLIHLLGEERKLIIQGPPGTGKSQSLTAIITNALENNARCLVVCEKKTALEVLKNNLAKIGLDHLCVVIDDVNKDRKKVVDAIRNIVDGKNELPFGNLSVNDYEMARSRFEKIKVQANQQYHHATAKVLGDFSWKDAIAKKMSAEKKLSDGQPEQLPQQGSLAFTIEELASLEDQIRDAQYLFEAIGQLDCSLKLFKATVFERKFSQTLRNELDGKLVQVQENLKTLHKQLAKAETSFGDKLWDQKSQGGLLFFIKSIFNSKLKQMKATATELEQQALKLDASLSALISNHPVEGIQSGEDISRFVSENESLLEQLQADMRSYKPFHDWQYFKSQTAHQQARVLIDHLEQVPVADWYNCFQYWYFNSLLMAKEHEQVGVQNQDDRLLRQLNELTAEIQKHQAQYIITQQSKKVQQTLSQKNRQSLKLLFNYRKNKAHQSKTSLRKILDREFDLFTDFFPVTMVNPVVCSSIIPMQADLYDLVIFDEASQIRLEDSYAALMRGKFKIVSGDVHQMPPSSYFSKGGEAAEEEEGDEEDVALAGSESLLTFAKDSSFKFSYLDFHYRSKHPHLIDFSNAAFYGGRLVPMPNSKNYSPIKFHEVNGLYENRTNPTEAMEIVKFLANEIKPDQQGQLPSVGVATFNMDQRNLIWDMIFKACEESAEFSKKLQALTAAGFFVKNLENIQGDERDIIMLSTTFGCNTEGKFRQIFGQLNNVTKGYKLLNVIVTRAKEQLHVFSSFPSESYAKYLDEIATSGNNGKGILYAYLAYARACSNGNEEERQGILNHLQQYSAESSSAAEVGENETESPFEQEVYEYLLDFFPKESIVLQYPFGGFRLDFVLKNSKGEPVICLEADGKKFHESDEAYRYDLHRQNILEQHGFKVYRIWSTNWWQDPLGEIQKLRRYAEQYLN